MLNRWLYLIIIILSVSLIKPAFSAFPTTRTDIDTAANTAYSAVCVDLDQDGDIDVVAAENADNEIVWYANGGSPGTTSNWTKYTIEDDFTGAISVFPIDLDKDGDIDVVAAANTEDHVAWFENRGDLTGSTTTDPDDDWDEHAINTAFDGARSVHALDLDFDGDMDVVACADTEDDVSWFENRGDMEGSTTDTDDDWNEVSVEGDFNGANSVYPVDLDSDGDIDIVGAENVDNTVSWFENLGDPTKAVTPTDTDDDWREITIDTTFNGASSVFPVDMDRDGDIDVLASANTGDEVSWYENKGDPTKLGTTGTTDDDWEERSIDASHDAPNYVIASDIDGDGDFDVLCAADQAGIEEVSWWASDGNPETGTWTQTVIDSTVGDAQTATPYDLDRDGDIDIIQSAANRVSWYASDINRSSSDMGFKLRAQIDAEYDGARAASAVDLDSDGEMDVVAVSQIDDLVSWWRNNGSESFTQYDIDTTLDDAWYAFTVDLDIDGNMDVVACSRLNDTIKWYESGGNPTSGGWTAHTVSTTIDGPYDMIAIDLDRDGDLDLVAVTYISKDLVWYESADNPTGSSNWTLRTIYDGSNSLTSVRGADIDQDGDYDLVISSDSDGFVRWFENDGTPATVTTTDWESHNVDTNVGTVRSLRIADIDKDGDLDIAGAIPSENDIVWWTNDGTPDSGVWVQNNIYDDFDGSESVHVSDIDRDGDLDVFGVADDLNDVYWFDSSSSGTSWTANVLDYDFVGPNSSFSVDIDKDGDIDLISAAFRSKDVSWWENVADEDADTPTPNIETGSELPTVAKEPIIPIPPVIEAPEEEALPEEAPKKKKKKKKRAKRKRREPRARPKSRFVSDREDLGRQVAWVIDYDNMMVLHYLSGAKVILIVNPAEKRSIALLFEQGIASLSKGESLYIKQERGPRFALKYLGLEKEGSQIECSLARLAEGKIYDEAPFSFAAKYPEEKIAKHLYNIAKKD